MVTETNKPAVDQEDLIKILGDLSTMTVSLDEDPLDYDPKRLSSKIKECRDHLDKVSTWALTSNKEAHNLKNKRRYVQELYELRERKLFEDDPEVKMGKHMEERKRMARNRLPEIVDELAWLLQGIEDHKTLQDSLKLKRDDLKNTQSQIKEQIKLCNECLGLGMRWGEKARPPLADLTPGLGQEHIQASIQDARNIAFSPYSEQDRANAVQLGPLDDAGTEMPSTEKTSEGVDFDLGSMNFDDVLSDSEDSDSDNVDVGSIIDNLSEENALPEGDTEDTEESSEEMKESSEEIESQSEELLDVTIMLEDVLEGDSNSSSKIEIEAGKIEIDSSKTEEEGIIDSVLDSDEMAQAAKPSAGPASIVLSFENLEDIFET